MDDDLVKQDNAILIHSTSDNLFVPLDKERYCLTSQTEYNKQATADAMWSVYGLGLKQKT
jgi:hypothetical protein